MCLPPLVLALAVAYWLAVVKNRGEKSHANSEGRSLMPAATHIPVCIEEADDFAVLRRALPAARSR